MYSIPTFSRAAHHNVPPFFQKNGRILIPNLGFLVNAGRDSKLAQRSWNWPTTMVVELAWLFCQNWRLFELFRFQPICGCTPLTACGHNASRAFLLDIASWRSLPTTLPSLVFFHSLVLAVLAPEG